jgi:hypothetical protein
MIAQVSVSIKDEEAGSATQARDTAIWVIQVVWFIGPQTEVNAVQSGRIVVGLLPHDVELLAIIKRIRLAF